MLEEAVRWVQRNTRNRIRFGEDGHGRDEPEYPTTVVRELISNALVHRDLGPHALAYPITLVLAPNQLVVSNQGGLWEISVDRLGRERISSARNDSLLRIAQNVRTSDGRRVVEALASGIPAVLEAVSAAGMVPPAFHDQGIRFTVRVPNHALLGDDDLAWLVTVAAGLPLSDTQRHALVAMRHGRRWTNKAFRQEYPRDSTLARADLQGLVDAGLAVAEGERGGRTYSLAPGLEARRRTQPDLFDDLVQERDADSGPESSRPKGQPAGRRETNAERVAALLRSRPMTMGDLVAGTDWSRSVVKYALQYLRSRGEVTLEGRRGDRTSTYRLTDRNNEGASG
jgi:ATP-dependent DNA helicase RecG